MGLLNYLKIYFHFIFLANAIIITVSILHFIYTTKTFFIKSFMSSYLYVSRAHDTRLFQNCEILESGLELSGIQTAEGTANTYIIYEMDLFPTSMFISIDIFIVFCCTQYIINIPAGLRV
jgi:hypothetical protein